MDEKANGSWFVISVWGFLEVVKWFLSVETSIQFSSRFSQTQDDLDSLSESNPTQISICQSSRPGLGWCCFVNLSVTVNIFWLHSVQLLWPVGWENLSGFSLARVSSWKFMLFCFDLSCTCWFPNFAGFDPKLNDTRIVGLKGKKKQEKKENKNVLILYA